MKKILIGLCVLGVLSVGGLTLTLATLDLNSYRNDIAATLSERTGRSFRLEGPLKLGVSLKGAVLELSGLTISNPSWASRPNMVNVPHVNLGVAVLPLLQGHLVLTNFTMDNADIQFEASKDHHNWEFATSGATVPLAQKTNTPRMTSRQISLHIASVTITKSQISFRSEDGKITTFKADNLNLKQQTTGTLLTFKGFYNDTPIALKLETNADDLTSDTTRPIKADLHVAHDTFKAEGNVDVNENKAMFDTYEVVAGKSDVNGKMAVDWAGEHPSFIGTITSDHLGIDDFKIDQAESAVPPATTQPTPPAARVRMFSDASLDLSSLTGVDATFDIALKEVNMGKITLQQFEAKLALKKGELFLSPMTADIGTGKVSGQLHVNAAVDPPNLGLTLNATDLDMTDLLHSASLISGKVNADMNIASTGNSMHALASNLNGTLNVIGAGGDIVTRSSDRIMSGLQDLVQPGSGKGEENLNCMIARFIAANGLVRDNGILIDTGAATVAGNGDIDLRGEVIDLQFRTRPKLVDTSGLLPPVHVGGTLLNPETSINTEAVVQNVVGSLLGGKAPAEQEIPDVVAQQGQNACLGALNHSAAAKTDQQPQQGVVQKLGGKAGQLLKGLLGQ
jgi:uncharacterized protein involved in outer membrane biogenesis